MDASIRKNKSAKNCLYGFGSFRFVSITFIWTGGWTLFTANYLGGSYLMVFQEAATMSFRPTSQTLPLVGDERLRKIATELHVLRDRKWRAYLNSNSPSVLLNFTT